MLNISNYFSNYATRLVIILAGLFSIFFASSIHARQPYYPAAQYSPVSETISSSIEVPVIIPLKPWAEK